MALVAGLPAVIINNNKKNNDNNIAPYRIHYNLSCPSSETVCTLIRTSGNGINGLLWQKKKNKNDNTKIRNKYNIFFSTHINNGHTFIRGSTARFRTGLTFKSPRYSIFFVFRYWLPDTRVFNLCGSYDFQKTKNRFHNKIK